MKEIELHTDLLIETIKESDSYQEYKRALEVLERDAALKERVDRFRRENFRFQQNPDMDLEESKRLRAEAAALHQIPAAGDYLDGEMAVCKMLQRITRKLTDSVDIRIPSI